LCVTVTLDSVSGLAGRMLLLVAYRLHEMYADH